MRVTSGVPGSISEGSRVSGSAPNASSGSGRRAFGAAIGIGAAALLVLGIPAAWPACAEEATGAPVATSTPATPDTLFQAAHARFQRGRSLEQLHHNTAESKAEFMAAYEGYTKAYEADPGGALAPRALYMAGSAKLFLDEPVEATSWYQKVVDGFPGNSEYRAKALLKKAAVEKNSLRVDEARSSLAKYREIFPDGGPAESTKEATRIEKSLRQIGAPATRVDAERWLPAGTDATNVGGQPAMLYFWATWCPNCLKEVAFINSLHERFGQRLRMIGVTHNSRGQTDASVESYLAEHGLRFPNAIDRDGVSSKAYSAGVVPTAVLIDSAGVVRWHDHPAALTDSTIEALLGSASGSRP